MKRAEGSSKGRRRGVVVAFAALIAFGGAGLAGCSQSYKADTYAADGVLRTNKVERGVIIGFREVKIRANGTVGAVTGGAMGGILGSQSGTFGVNAALGTVGGTTLGGILGTTIEHVTGDTIGWEYIVQKKDGELLSVTQQDDAAVPIGQKVLIITGVQSRLVPDYSVSIDPAPAKPTPLVTSEPPPAVAPAVPPPTDPAPAAASGASSTTPAAPSAPAPSVSSEPSPAPEARAPEPAPEQGIPPASRTTAPQ